MPSNLTDVTEALLALNDDPRIPFTVSRRDDGKIVAEWTYVNTSSDNKTYRLTITPLPETNEYKASSLTVEGAGSAGAPVAGTWKFSTSAVTTPVYAVLTEHGWERKKSFLGKLFS
ncbi:hypothetical protein GCM10025867_12110 [Frondihabitans sucicola]|uniref:Uncharacterized protein n=1 Tax=Frondihabitans sucicola TaxID=1268041 RepID=A0ABM8GKQ0_9MICO|nr:hypothetical protein [Frondihabitans sucicola]BDZ48970.1 hypothetical protein GCM10025867_12110 [Frondihabitans sucicola]